VSYASTINEPTGSSNLLLLSDKVMIAINAPVLQNVSTDSYPEAVLSSPYHHALFILKCVLILGPYLLPSTPVSFKLTFSKEIVFAHNVYLYLIVTD
jgi:hypothetical protein